MTVLEHAIPVTKILRKVDRERGRTNVLSDVRRKPSNLDFFSNRRGVSNEKVNRFINYKEERRRGGGLYLRVY